MIKKKTAIILVVLAVAILGGLYATGHLTRESAEDFGRRAYYRGRGAVNEAVDAVGSAAQSGGSGDPAKAAVCRDNLRRIETAKRAAANELGLAVGDIPQDEINKALGGSMPRCPDGGRYRVHALNTMPTCSVGAGNVSDPNDDHVVIGF
jgi:hypothetical protein